MKRYIKANEEIRTPDALRARVVDGKATRTLTPRRVIVLATAAALLAALGLGAALLRTPDEPPLDVGIGQTPIAPNPEQLETTPSSPYDGPLPTETGIPITLPPASTAAPGGDPVQPVQPATSTQPEPAVLRLTEVSYPAQPQYPVEYDQALHTAWRDADRARRAAVTADDNTALAAVSDALMRQLLTSTDETAGQNRVISPLNLYLALAMLSETTDGTSRTALLELLGEPAIESVRSRASNLFTANYLDDGTVITRLASSIWLRDGFPFRQDTLNKLAITHRAASFSGVMGSDALNTALRGWLSENTGGLLDAQIDGVEFDPDTVLGLATTIYYSARWTEEFAPSKTVEQTFHARTGDVKVPFMHSSRFDEYFDGDGFGAVRRSLINSGSMWLILPDEGTTTDDLLAQGDLLALTGTTLPADVKKTHTQINLALPKFDVTCNLNLKDGLTALGLGDLFSPDTADFSPLTENASLADEIYLGSAQHAARVKIDEEGCEGAAFTLMMATATGGYIPTDEIDFVLDRPFIFIVTSPTMAPLFAGVVEMP